jgi:hypothetical protein
MNMSGDAGLREEHPETLKTFGPQSNYHAKEGFHRGIVRMVLPEKWVPLDRWLRRKEAAHLLRVCWCAREAQTVHRGPLQTDKRLLRHLADLF